MNIVCHASSSLTKRTPWGLARHLRWLSRDHSRRTFFWVICVRVAVVSMSLSYICTCHCPDILKCRRRSKTSLHAWTSREMDLCIVRWRLWYSKGRLHVLVFRPSTLIPTALAPLPSASQDPSVFALPWFGLPRSTPLAHLAVRGWCDVAVLRCSASLERALWSYKYSSTDTNFWTVGSPSMRTTSFAYEPDELITRQQKEMWPPRRPHGEITVRRFNVASPNDKSTGQASSGSHS